MAQGVLTEREWRRRAVRASRPGPRCWGAQCLRPPRPPAHQRRGVHAGMLAASLACALLLPAAVPPRRAADLYQTASIAQAQTQSVQAVRPVSTVSYAAPEGLAYVDVTFGQEELLRGKLLLLDEHHPLPPGAPAPNTMSIARFGKGMVPVNDLNVKSGKETIKALSRLFAALRGKGVDSFTVCRGTMTPWEQGEWRLETLRSLAGQMPLDSARSLAVRQTDAPGTGELQQEYTVELCLNVAGPSIRPLGKTEQGVALLHTAWRYGFLPLDAGESGDSCRLRYVGEAHATAMTYLDMTLGDYLELLHQKGSLHVRRSEQLEYLILCRPVNNGYVEFHCPENALREVSLDNTGYAVMACVLPGNAE